MIKSKKHLSHLLQASWQELQQLAIKKDQYYYKKLEYRRHKDGRPKLDKNGMPRVRIIYPSTSKLKIIQGLINTRILNKVGFSKAAVGGVKGCDNIKNSKRHQGKKFKFLTDLKDCFPNINSGMVYKALILYGFSADIASILTKLTTYKNQIPQGARTSTSLCNIVMKSLDDELLILKNNNEITYTRFVDDLSFSSHKDFKNLVPNIIEIIKNAGNVINHRKTGYIIGSCMITGNRCNNNNLGISNELTDKIFHPEQYNSKQIAGQHRYAMRVLGEDRFIRELMVT